MLLAILSFPVSAEQKICAPGFKLSGDFCIRQQPYSVYFARLKANTNCSTKTGEYSKDNYYCVRK